MTEEDWWKLIATERKHDNIPNTYFAPGEGTVELMLVFADWLLEQTGRENLAVALQWTANHHKWPRLAFESSSYDWWDTSLVHTHDDWDELPHELFSGAVDRKTYAGVQDGLLEFETPAKAFEWLGSVLHLLHT